MEDQNDIEREIVGFRTPTPFMAIAIASFFTDFREQRLREFAKFWLHHSIDGIWMLPEIVSSFVKHKKTIDGRYRKLEHIRELTFFHIFFFVLGFTFLGYEQFVLI
jgi:hypothetical protein